MNKIIRIHGTGSHVTFEMEDTAVFASGEFISSNGKIDGFAVSSASLMYEKGQMLTDEERQELIARFEEYVSRPEIEFKLRLEFD